MAIITGMWSLLRGSVAGLTFRQQNGVTIVSQRTKPRDTRSRAKMWRRCQWNNVMSMYKLLGINLIDTFEDCLTKRNTCNHYVHLNLERNPLFLTREQKALGACIVAPHQVSDGSLPTITHRLSADNLITTDIKLSADLDGDTTVASLSADIVGLNPDFRYGDILIICRIQQTTQVVDGIDVPRAEIQTTRLTLSKTDTRSPLPDGGLQLCCHEGTLALAEALDNEGACFIHLRRNSSGILRASSQQLLCVNTLIDQYGGEDAFQQAARSYGGIEAEPFLQPTTQASDTADSQPTNDTAASTVVTTAHSTAHSTVVYSTVQPVVTQPVVTARAAPIVGHSAAPRVTLTTG